MRKVWAYPKGYSERKCLLQQKRKEETSKDLLEELLSKKNKDEIRNQIRKRKYKPMPALRVEIPKDNGKTRKLGIPTVVDRVIQQAISQKLSPIFEQQFSEYSFGFRPRRSCEQAVVKALE